jgi:cytoskeletal protein CcmA (bactofilin family)
MSVARPNLEVEGKERVPGGLYDTVSVDGKLVVDGDLDARALVVQGTASVTGQTRIGRLEVAGKVELGGPVEAQSVLIQGKGELGGDLKGERVEVSGRLSVAGDVTVREFSASGRFEITGALRADQVSVELLTTSRAASIVASSVRVVTRPDNAGTVVQVRARGVRITNVSGGQTQPSRLEVESVSGDTVTLEATTARRVSGRSVVLGPGCDIGRVEYREQLEVDPAATVGSAERVIA